MNHYLRRTLPLVSVAALVSSALAAGTGAAFAGKAPPTAELNSGDCQVQELRASFWRTRYDATLDLTDNKGRWLFVEALVEFDAGGDLETNVPRPTKVDEGAWLTVEATDYETTAQPAALILTFTDRKGTTVNTERFRLCGDG